MSSRRVVRGIALVAMVVVMVVLAACQAAPAPTATPQPAASGSQAASKLFLMVDIVQGSKNLTDAEKAAKSCVLNSRFPRNSQVVWRARIYDPATGEAVGDDVISDAEVKLANGESIKMSYGRHPASDPNADAYWTGAWVIPKDNPTGTVDFTVTATATDGRTGEFKPFNVASSLLTVTGDVLPDVSG